jgi:predicted transcriptional regulator
VSRKLCQRTGPRDRILAALVAARAREGERAVTSVRELRMELGYAHATLEYALQGLMREGKIDRVEIDESRDRYWYFVVEETAFSESETTEPS